MDFNCPLKSLSLSNPETPALVDKSAFITFKLFDQLSSSLASGLRNQGIIENTRVVLHSTNRIELPITMYALFRLGAIAVLLSPRYPAKILEKQITELSCDYQIIFDKEQSLPEIKTLDYHKLIDLPCSKCETIYPALDQPAVISFTSGSSGIPKAVLHSFGNLFLNALEANKNIPFIPGDNWLLSLPIYHVGGLGIIFRSLAGGGTVVIADPGDDFLPLLHRYAITHLSLVPTQLLRLLKNNSKNILSDLNLKAVLVGGSQLPDSLVMNAQACGLPIYRTYGLTEMASQVATSTHAGSPMRLLQHCRMTISDEKEILVKGSSLFKGYVTQSGLEKTLSKDGWFKTGDCGSIDRNGNVQICGRIDNMFISGGENIHPEGIEAGLLTLDCISNAIVLPIDDAEFGKRPVAFIDLNPLSKITEITTQLAKILPSFCIPIHFYKWPDKINQSGIKIDRQFFRQLLNKKSQSDIILLT